MPPHPDCTYDVVPEIPALEQRDPPRSRLEKLENRINELEALLSEQNKGDGQSVLSPDTATPSRTGSSLSNGRTFVDSPPSSIGPSSIEQSIPEPVIDPILSLPFPPSHYNGSLDSLADAAILIENPAASAPSMNQHHASNTPATGEAVNAVFNTLVSDPIMDAVSTTWRRNLPSPDLVRHLVDAFFSWDADANRLLHRATFMASLLFPPTHPRFPLSGLLHAICAVGSLYTAAVDPTPNPTVSAFPMDNIFDGRHRQSEQRPFSFAEVQAEHARREIEMSVEMGEGLFQGLQAEVLLSSWYWASAKWSEAFMSASRSLRCSIPLGLNIGTPFHAQDGMRPPSIIIQAKTIMEEEMRRNTFWLAYALERTMGCGHGWALMLDDKDITQMLPLTAAQFENGEYVPPERRQWSNHPDVLLVHPPDQTDAFVLYIKSTMLISRVKVFNSRFRAKFYSGDPEIVNMRYTSLGEVDGLDPKDIRCATEFAELSRLVGRFQDSIPSHMRHPVKDGVVNAHLFAACTAPLLAHILLHETHAHVGSETCQSSLKILNGSRGILNLVYDIYSTSHDLALLGPFAMVSWFMAGRVLVRFLREALSSGSNEQIQVLQMEISFIRTVLSQVGERVALAHRYSKMLYDFICANCGSQHATPAQMLALPPRGGMGSQPFPGGEPNTSDLALNLMINNDHISRW